MKLEVKNLKDSLNSLANMQVNERMQDKKGVYKRKGGEIRGLSGTTKNKS